MTVLPLSVPRGALSPAGGDARLVVGGRVARAATRSGALWGCVFGLFVVVQTVAFTAQYDTQAARDQMAATYGTEGGLTAVLGQPDALNTVAGWATWRFVGILGLLGSVWGVLLATRLLRGEEEAGQLDALLVRPVSRARWLAGRLAVSCLLLGCAGVAAGVGAWVGTAGQSDGIGAGDLVTAGVNIVPPGLFLLGLGTLAFGGWPPRYPARCLRLPDLGFSRRVLRRRRASQSLAAGHVCLLPRVPRTDTPGPVERRGRQRPRARGGRARRLPLPPQRPSRRMSAEAPGRTRSKYERRDT